MQKSPSACRTVRRIVRNLCSVGRQKTNVKILGKLYMTVVRSGQGHYRKHNKRNGYDGYGKLQRSTG